VAAATTYLACRIEGFSRTLQEVSVASGVDKNIIGRMQMTIAQELKLGDVGLVLPEHIVPRIVCQSRYRQSWNVDTVAEIARQVCKAGSESGIFDGMQPSAVAAAYVLLSICAYTLTMQQQKTESQSGSMTALPDIVIKSGPPRHLVRPNMLADITVAKRPRLKRHLNGTNSIGVGIGNGSFSSGGGNPMNGVPLPSPPPFIVPDISSLDSAPTTTKIEPTPRSQQPSTNVQSATPRATSTAVATIPKVVVNVELVANNAMSSVGTIKKYYALARENAHTLLPQDIVRKLQDLARRVGITEGDDVSPVIPAFDTLYSSMKPPKSSSSSSSGKASASGKSSGKSRSSSFTYADTATTTKTATEGGSPSTASRSVSASTGSFVTAPDVKVAGGSDSKP
jgi:hypothetical protein